MHELSSLLDFERPPASCYPAASVVTIGNFDGCHLGHQSLIEAAKSFALDTLALTFHPRPEAFFKGASDDGLQLFSPFLKRLAFREAGLNALLIQDFDQAFSQLTPERFYSQILKTYLNAKAVVVGENFCFGFKRQGNTTWLRKRGQEDDTTVAVMAPRSAGGLPISSTRIRTALLEGRVDLAAQLLGRPYLLYGSIHPGDQLGRQLGVPTANLAVSKQLIPADGVYAGQVWLGREGSSATPPVLNIPAAGLIPAVFSIGRRPSIPGQPGDLRIEAHLLAGSYGANELYGKTAGFYLRHFIRPDARFASLASLSKQMQDDISKARRLLETEG